METNKDIQALSDTDLLRKYAAEAADYLESVASKTSRDTVWERCTGIAADLRHALVTSQPAPVASTPAVATVVGRAGDDLRVGWLRPENCGVGTLLYTAPQPSAAPVAADVAQGEALHAIAKELKADAEAFFSHELSGEDIANEMEKGAQKLEAIAQRAASQPTAVDFSAPTVPAVGITDSAAPNGIKWHINLPEWLRDGMQLYFVPPRCFASQPDGAPSLKDFTARTLPPKGYEDCIVVQRNGQLIWLRRDDVLPTDGVCFYDGDCREVLTPYDSRVRPPIKLAVPDSERDAYANAEYPSWSVPPVCVICEHPGAVRTPLMRNEMVCRQCYMTWYDTGEVKPERIRELSLAHRAAQQGEKGGAT